jgi:hypothetical protein
MKGKIVETYNADNIRVGFNPVINVIEGKQSSQSLTMDFHTEKG